MSRSPRAARTEEDAPPTDWLAELPHELHLRILEGVDDFSDCAAFSLASPRLGLLALRGGLARFKDPLFAVAMRLLLSQRFVGGFGVVTLSEATLRRYAADRRASAEHFPWLARVSPALRLTSEVEGAGERRAEVWRLRHGENGAKLRSRSLQGGQVKHFEGERGAERKVRKVFASGTVHYEGERGAELKVRSELANGEVHYYEGERGAEQKVRTEFPNGNVKYFEGERGEERKVREVFASGQVHHYEGERGAERVVRKEFPSGVHYYEGEKGGERKVRTELANGNVKYYEGERGAERVVRKEFPIDVVYLEHPTIPGCFAAVVAKGVNFEAIQQEFKSSLELSVDKVQCHFNGTRHVAFDSAGLELIFAAAAKEGKTSCTLRPFDVAATLKQSGVDEGSLRPPFTVGGGVASSSALVLHEPEGTPVWPIEPID